MGPPSDANGWTLNVTCASSLETATIGQWVCEHRDPSILNMVSFRHVVAGTDIKQWWGKRPRALALSRGNKGFVALQGGGDSPPTAGKNRKAAGSHPGPLRAELPGVGQNRRGH